MNNAIETYIKEKINVKYVQVSTLMNVRGKLNLLSNALWQYTQLNEQLVVFDCGSFINNMQISLLFSTIASMESFGTLRIIGARTKNTLIASYDLLVLFFWFVPTVSYTTCN